jgi:hypothetical protein
MKLALAPVALIVMTWGALGVAQSKLPETHTHIVPDPSSSTGNRTEIHSGSAPSRGTGDWVKEYSGQAWKTVKEFVGRDPPPPPPPRGGGIRGVVFERDSSWTGSWVQKDCVETGGATGGACALPPSSGRFSLEVKEVGTNATGRLHLGGCDVALRGSRERNGLLHLTGSGKIPKATVSVEAFEITNLGEEAPTASFTAKFTPNDRKAGTITMKGALEPITRFSSK